MKKDQGLEALLSEAREISWNRFGKGITFYVPGMFTVDGKRGKYPAISLSGQRCLLKCDHCSGEILKSMIRAPTPKTLVEICLRLKETGAEGCLITGGSDRQGRLPWPAYAESIREVKRRIPFHISVHAGIIDRPTADCLKEAGIDQALIDVAGADETVQRVMHLEGGVEVIRRSLESLHVSGLEVVPHIVVGLHYGRILGERRALDLLKGFDPRSLVFVVLMPLPRTPMEGVSPPSLEQVGRLIGEARLLFPEAEISLGCARPRGRLRIALERLAIDAGVNRMALYSEEAIERARSYGLLIDFASTCCSVGTR